MLKFRLLTLMLVCLVGTLMVSAVAQDNSASQPPSPPQGAPGQWRGHGMPDPAKRTEMLTKQLGLTSEQQPKVLDAFKSEQSQMESLRSDTSLSQEDRHSKMMEIHKSTTDQVRSILNPDQQKKFDEMQAKREQWQHNKGGQAPPPPPDSSNQ